MKPRKPDARVDVRNLISPLSLLKVENTLSQLARGQVMEVLCMDEETKTDLLVIMRNGNHHCISVKKRTDYFTLFFEKGEDRH